jgi:uncharacterized protein with PIN domain
MDKNMQTELRFIVDINAGKLAHWLRMMGYDTVLFMEKDDGIMVKTALVQDRIILTRDREIFKRRLVTSGRVKAMLLWDSSAIEQVKAVVKAYYLDYNYRPFSLCLGCNSKLVQKDRAKVQHSVPPHVFQTQTTYMECPSCHRIYWKGTHWEAMSRQLAAMTNVK